MLEALCAKVHHELNVSRMRSHYVRVSVSVSVIWRASLYCILLVHTIMHDYACDIYMYESCLMSNDLRVIVSVIWL